MKFAFGLAIASLAPTMVLAQFAGPAILSRGEAPAAVREQQIKFRPYAEITTTYDTGLAGVSITSQGQLANQDEVGVRLAWGVSGNHGWRHTKLGLDYRGELYHYPGLTFYDATNQAILLGISHQFSPHTLLTLRESAGTFSRNFSLPGLSQAVPFDPVSSYIPTTDFFDNQTIYLTSQVDFTIQTSNRLSFNVGGDGIVNRRRSTALAGVVGAVARGDIEYRLSRRTSVGLVYNYMHYDFTRIFGGTDVQGLSGGYSNRFSRTLEFSGYGGVMRSESKFIQSVPVDPVIAALLGIQSAPRVAHSIRNLPNIGGRLSKYFSKGIAYVSGGHSVTPGNGLFLTSFTTSALAGYRYSGLRRWSLGAEGGYSVSRAVGTIAGDYGGATVNASFTRQMGRVVHMLGQVNMRKYSSGDFRGYNRWIYDIRFGFGFTPPDVPLRLW